jgi:transcriptional regulator with XRE-family HTH domain
MNGVPAPARLYITTEEAGQRLRRVREKLGLKFRDVEEASQRIADRYGNEEFVIGLSRLSEMENRGLMPTIYRLYSLSTIYRLSFLELLGWYGVHLDEQAADSQMFPVAATHPVGFPPKQARTVTAPLALDPGIDLTKTTFLSRLINRWGPLPLDLFRDADLAKQKFALLGTEDWTMYPILRPGSLLLIEEAKKIASSGWKTEWERPIYFLEHREGFAAGWCSLDRDRLIVLPHHSAKDAPRVFLYPQEVDVIGVVKGVAMILDQPDQRPLRT